MGDAYQVVIPENVELDYEIAGIGTRFLAMAIDFLIQSFLAGALIIGLQMFGIANSDLNQKIPDLKISMLTGLIIILFFAVNFGYFIILETVMNGQTIGKKLLNIRVRRDGGSAPVVWDILLRNIIRIVDWLPALYTIGILVMFLNPKAKRLGDYAAGTVVVKELSRHQVRQMLTKIAAEPDASPLAALETDYPWVKSVLPFVSQSEYLIIKSLLSRREQLSNFSTLAHETIVKLFAKSNLVTIPEPNPAEAVAILELITKAYEKTAF